MRHSTGPLQKALDGMTVLSFAADAGIHCLLFNPPLLQVLVTSIDGIAVRRLLSFMSRFLPTSMATVGLQVCMFTYSPFLWDEWLPPHLTDNLIFGPPLYVTLSLSRRSQV